MAFVDLEKEACSLDAMWWEMYKLGIDKWLVHLVQSMYKDVGSRVRVGDGYSEDIDVRVSVRQDSVLSPLLFVIVLKALYREFCTCCPWELLYADDLMISAGFMSMEEFLVKLETWKSEIKKMGLQVNMGKTKIIVSGFDLDLLKEFGKDPCSVYQKGVGSNAISCGGCLCWIHKKCNGIRAPCALTLISGASDAWVQHDLLMEEQ